MSRYAEHNQTSPADDAFVCVECGRFVSGGAPGTDHRNHCPHCLTSRHVDMKPGDRRSGCRGTMRTIAVEVKRGGEWALVHRCDECGAVRTNRTAGDDNELALMSIAVRPLASPPFPLRDLLGSAGKGK